MLIGFGIRDRKTFEQAAKYAAGAIIGTAYIKAIENSANIEQPRPTFLTQFYKR